MKLTLLVVASLAICSNALAGQIWTDGNGDGLPDAFPILAPPNTNMTVGVWIDAQSFTWTNYIAFVEWTAECITYVDATYVVTGGANFPIDDFSHPSGVGFGGSGFTQSGVDHIGNVILQVSTSVACCVTPIIDTNNPFGVFSQLGAGEAYQLFTTNPGTCFGEYFFSGACCFSTGECQILTEDACTAQGGLYRGDSTTCAQVFCEVLGGACCFPDGTCAIQTPGGCFTSGGDYAGDGVSCAQANCPATGACCFPAPSCGTTCQNLTAAACAAAGGAFFGSGTACIPPSGCPLNPPPCVGACCFPDGSCAIVTEITCISNGGVYAGDDVECGAANCSPPTTGACCTPGAGCLESVTLEECNANGGLWYPNVPCAQGCEPDAVESTSWGAVKGLYR